MQGTRGGIVSYSIGTDSETGCLRTVLVHRPGPELTRITPRTRSRLRFDGQPWLARARQEHDTLTDVLRDRGAEVLYVTELLQDVLEYQSARNEAVASVLADAELGDVLGAGVREHLELLAPEELASVLIAGLTPAELRSGNGLVYDLLDPHDFVIDPLPNLVFTRDSSTWIGDQAIVASLPGPRLRENNLTPGTTPGPGNSTAGTSCCSGLVSSPSASACVPRRPARNGWPGTCWTPESCIPCWPCR